MLAAYLVFGALLVAVNIVFDYARIRLVVEDRRSAIGALLAAGRFVRRHGGGSCWPLWAECLSIPPAHPDLRGPGPRSSRRQAVDPRRRLRLGEAYILARLYLKLLFYASETALFQGALAHAAYTAAPAVVWPDSPAAESIANADRSPAS